MSELDDDKPLPPVIRAALLAEGLDGGPSEEARARMAAKLAVAVGLPAAALIGAKAIGGAPVSAAVGHAAVSAGKTAALSGKTAALSGKAIALVIGALLIGGGAGVAIGELHGRNMASRTATTPLASRQDAAIAPPDATLVDAPAADATRPEDAHSQKDRSDTFTPVVKPDAGATPAADQLARERELIDVARSALRSGDTRLATKSLVEHELRYPSGSLSEERRALLIEVAVVSGDRAKAQALAAEFRSAYPHSVFQARIGDLLR